jgi:carbamoyl-phosphate synthase/aspartate carbamoyltransferase
MNHLLSVLQLTKNQILRYIEEAEKFKFINTHCQNRGDICRPLKNYRLINLFYEPSTRTSCSFHSAMVQLGGDVITITDKYSSVEKGESLEDTIKTVSQYGDIIVLRHPQKGSSQRAASVATVPVINAGDGNGEHPTQALLDIFTIKTELAKYNLDIISQNRENITVTFMGDLKNSRTIHSLIYILILFPRMKFQYVCPVSLEMPPDIINKINEQNIEQIYVTSLEEALKTTDVLYVTRIQKERFDTEEEYNKIMNNNTYKINKQIIEETAKEKMIIMHPLPRLDEINTDLDTDPRAVYFEQVKNGVYMRMALLKDLIL